MIFPAITSVYAALLAIEFIVVSAWVVAGRVQSDTMFGDGGNPSLSRRVRTQANFAEYVPYALLLIALLEADGAARGLIQVLCFVLLVARLAHPVGMFAAKDSLQQYACRGGGIIATFLVMLVAALALIVRLV